MRIAAGFAAPESRPGFPPLATMYISEEVDGQVYAPVEIEGPAATGEHLL